MLCPFFQQTTRIFVASSKGAGGGLKAVSFDDSGQIITTSARRLVTLNGGGLK